MALTPEGRRTSPRIVQAFADAIPRTRGLLAEDRYEPEGFGPHVAGPRLDGDVLARVQALAVPVSILASLGREDGAGQADACDAYAAQAAAWLRDMASWIRHGTGSDDLPSSLPQARVVTDGETASPRTAWCRILNGDMQDVLRSIGLPATTAPRSASTQETSAVVRP